MQEVSKSTNQLKLTRFGRPKFSVSLTRAQLLLMVVQKKLHLSVSQKTQVSALSYISLSNATLGKFFNLPSVKQLYFWRNDDI